MKRMLYIMPVNWGWIAQRPHFLALELEKRYDVTVAYPLYLFETGQKQKTTKRPKKSIGILQIPFQERVGVLCLLSRLFFWMRVGNPARYDIIWLGTPMFYRMIPKRYAGTVIFDYMDDVVAMQPVPSISRRVYADQLKLFGRADYIFTTSQYLIKTIPEQWRKKAALIRNGFDGEKIYPIKKAEKKGHYHLGYVGTIAEWMDFDLLLDSLRYFPNITYHFWGPKAVEVPKNERMIWHGIVEHKDIYKEIEDMDCLIMPFVINDVVRAVDPVKLYEYISYGKCIVSVNYDEVKRFEPFAFLYSGENEFWMHVKSLIKSAFSPKYNDVQRREFLEDNTWKIRAKSAWMIISKDEK